MISSTNNAPAIAIAQGEKWNILLKRNNTKNSIKSSIDGEGYKRNNEVNDTPKQYLKFSATYSGVNQKWQWTIQKQVPFY